MEEITKRIDEADDDGLNSPHIGRQIFVLFASKKNPWEQIVSSPGFGVV